MALYLLKEKTGNHSHVDKRGVRTLVKPGETFEAEPYEVENFMDKLERLTPEDPPPPPPPREMQLQVVKRKDGEGYDVFNPMSEKTINTAPLTKEQAEEIADVGGAEQVVEDSKNVGGGKSVSPRRGAEPEKPKSKPGKK